MIPFSGVGFWAGTMVDVPRMLVGCSSEVITLHLVIGRNDLRDHSFCTASRKHLPTGTKKKVRNNIILCFYSCQVVCVPGEQSLHWHARAEIFGQRDGGSKFAKKWLKRTNKEQVCKNRGCIPHPTGSPPMLAWVVENGSSRPIFVDCKCTVLKSPCAALGPPDHVVPKAYFLHLSSFIMFIKLLSWKILWTLFLKTSCIFSKNKATLDKVFNGSD